MREDARQRQIPLRLTEAEFARYTRAAALAGIPRSDFIRRAVDAAITAQGSEQASSPGHQV